MPWVFGDFTLDEERRQLLRAGAPIAIEPKAYELLSLLVARQPRLAVANVTGAMVFQGTLPVSLGLIGTEWVIAPTALTSMILAVQAAGLCLLQILIGGRWRPWRRTGR